MDKNSSDPIKSEWSLATELEHLAGLLLDRSGFPLEFHFPPKETDPDRVLRRAANALLAMDAEREQAYKQGFSLGTTVRAVEAESEDGASEIVVCYDGEEINDD